VPPYRIEFMQLERLSYRGTCSCRDRRSRASVRARIGRRVDLNELSQTAYRGGSSSAGQESSCVPMESSTPCLERWPGRSPKPDRTRRWDQSQTFTHPELRYSAMSAINWQRSALSKRILRRNLESGRSWIHLWFQVLWDRIVDRLEPGAAADCRLCSCIEETHLLSVSDLPKADQLVAIHFVDDLARHRRDCIVCEGLALIGSREV